MGLFDNDDKRCRQRQRSQDRRSNRCPGEDWPGLKDDDEGGSSLPPRPFPWG